MIILTIPTLQYIFAKPLEDINTTKMEKDKIKSLVDQQFSDVSSDGYITTNLLLKVAIMAPYFKQQYPLLKQTGLSRKTLKRRRSPVQENEN